MRSMACFVLMVNTFVFNINSYEGCDTFRILENSLQFVVRTGSLVAAVNAIMTQSIFDIIFRKLPAEITRNLVENWFNLEELGRMDSACCQADIRTLYLSTISMKYKIGAAVILNGKFADRFVRWSISRKILYHCKKLIPIRRSTPTPVYDTFDYLDLTVERNRNLIFSSDLVTIHTASMLLSVLSSDSHKEWKTAITRDVLGRLLELLHHDDDNIVLRSLCTVGNFIGKGVEQVQMAFECNCLPALANVLEHWAPNIRINAAWAIGNMTYGSAAHILAVFDSGVVPKLVSYLHATDVLWESNATRAILNITARGTPAQVMSVVELGVLPALCNILAGSNEDRTNEALRTLSNILIISGKVGRQSGVKNDIIECGGLIVIRRLQIEYIVANEVVRRYFGE